MTEKSFAISAGISGGLFIIGLMAGLSIATSGLREDAIKEGAAGYDKTTGCFRWNSELGKDTND